MYLWVCAYIYIYNIHIHIHNAYIHIHIYTHTHTHTFHKYQGSMYQPVDVISSYEPITPVCSAALIFMNLCIYVHKCWMLALGSAYIFALFSTSSNVLEGTSITMISAHKHTDKVSHQLETYRNT